jgi:diguanylate cyclase (GGDEF)-like protein
VNRQEQTQLDRAVAEVARLEHARRKAEEGARQARNERAVMAMRLEEMARLREDAIRESQTGATKLALRLAEVTELARTDALTGLPNRRGLDEELPRELARARRHDSPVCAVMLDFDHFKEFNDAMGHQAGDALLKETAAAWRNALRDTDFVAYSVARYGGEEFVVVLPDCDLDQATAVVERLRAVIPGDRTCSAGVARWNGVESADELLGRADAALYRAKRNGRDQAITATETLASGNGHRGQD